MCCQVEKSASADHSSRGVLPSVACITECVGETSIMSKPWPATGCCEKDEERETFSLILLRVSLTSLLIIGSLIISKELNKVNLTKQ